MCEGTLLGWLLISYEHLSFWRSLSNWGAGLRLATTPCQREPASVGQPKTTFSSLRGSSRSLVMKMISVMFISQVSVSLKKRRFAGMCACPLHTCLHSGVIFPLEKAIEKPTHPYEVGGTSIHQRKPLPTPLCCGYTIPNELLWWGHGTEMNMYFSFQCGAPWAMNTISLNSACVSSGTLWTLGA